MSTTPTLRPVHSLDGLWNFAFLGEIDLAAFTPHAIGFPFEKVPVPSAFDALPAWAGKRGAAVYRTTFAVPPGHPAQLQFGAVSLWSRVYVDGQSLHENACGYAPFRVAVPPAARAERELLVLVDNRFDFERVPMHEHYFDFYQYGGILRSVALRVLPVAAPYLEHVLVSPTDHYRAGEIELALHFGGIKNGESRVALAFDDQSATSVFTLPVADGRAVTTVRVPAPRLWSPNAPALHTVRVTLHPVGADAAVDDMTVRFGLRRIEARDGHLWLNGEMLRLRGYNRHEWHPNFGPCTPTLQMYADIQLLQDLGCNFVRGSHYQQDQRFLDLCDELGLLVWEENLGWGQRERTFASEKFQRDHRVALEAMLLHSYNHPSVILWGFLNEAGTDADYVRPVFEESAALIRALDPRRPLTYASMFALTDRHYDLADVISLNLYPGWYNCEDHPRPLELVRPHLAACFDHIDRAGFAAKPVLVSEIGAEGLYGWHDAHHDFFTEEYQAAYLTEACAAALGHPRCSGIALWHFSDARTYSGCRAMRRPRTYNNKGTFDEYRRPKLAAAAVRAAFRTTRGPAGI
ncbi:MAG: beta-galactosidase [Opitutaceae bacterium]|nr:beta-galactosidase [Opitutaceae bacterium]